MQELQLPVELKAMGWCITMPRNGLSAPVGLSLFLGQLHHLLYMEEIYFERVYQLCHPSGMMYSEYEWVACQGQLTLIQ